MKDDEKRIQNVFIFLGIKVVNHLFFRHYKNIDVVLRRKFVRFLECRHDLCFYNVCFGLGAL